MVAAIGGVHPPSVFSVGHTAQCVVRALAFSSRSCAASMSTHTWCSQGSCFECVARNSVTVIGFSFLAETLQAPADSKVSKRPKVRVKPLEGYSGPKDRVNCLPDVLGHDFKVKPVYLLLIGVVVTGISALYASR